MKFKILNQTYSERDDLSQQKLDLLFRGGVEIQKNANLFLPQLAQEHAKTYQNRLENACYTNFVSEIINDFVSTTFSQSLSVAPGSDAADDETPGEFPENDDFYRAFIANCDRKNHSLEQVMAHLLEHCLHNICGKVWIGIDCEDVSLEDYSQAQIEELGLSAAYTYDIPYGTVQNYKLNDYGRLDWIVLRNDVIPQDSPFDLTDKCEVQFIVWTMNNGLAQCQLFSKTYESGTLPNDDDDFPEVAIKTTSFRCIPILLLCIPVGLRIGTHLMGPQIEHYKLKSAYDFALLRNSQPILFYKQANELEDIGSIAAENVNRGEELKASLINKGFLVGSGKDNIDMLEPAGTTLLLFKEQLKDISDDIHSLAKQMASSIGGRTKYQSGDAKEVDNRSKELICEQYGTLIRDLIKEIFNTLSLARGDDVVWQVSGLSDYQIVDPADITARATSTNLMPVLNYSKTLKKAVLTDIGLSLVPDLEPSSVHTVRQEISESVDEEPSEQDILTMGISNEQGITKEEDSNSSVGSGEEKQSVSKDESN